MKVVASGQFIVREGYLRRLVFAALPRFTGLSALSLRVFSALSFRARRGICFLPRRKPEAARNNPSCALCRSLSVMNALKRETTIAKRFPDELRPPARPPSSGSGRSSEPSFLLSFFSVTRCLRGEFVTSFLIQSVLIRENPWPSIYLPLNFAARFSRNADVPSPLSSVAQQTPKSTASR